MTENSCNTLNIKSYKSSKTQNVPVGWYLEYWDDFASAWSSVKPSDLGWISFDITSGEGSVEGVDLTATVEMCSEDDLIITENKENQHNDILRATDRKGTENHPFDLSMHDIYGNENESGATTANSYVVNSGGWYAIPLVYGNAIKNNSVNTIAYAPEKPSDSITSFLTPFYNSMELGIKKPVH